MRGRMRSLLPEPRFAKRWPYFPGQGLALASAVAIFLGIALPWAVVLGDLFWGAPAALTWTLSGGCLVLAASMVRRYALVAASSLGGGAIAVYFAVWQTARILDRCRFSLDCLPGPGLGFLLAGGLGAAYVGVRLLAGYDARS
jgi:hypothetical protein